MQQTKAILNSKVGSKSYNQFLEEQMAENMRAEEAIRRDPRGKAAWARHTHLDPDEYNEALYTIPSNLFTDFYEETQQKQIDPLQAQFDSITYLR